MAFPRNSDNLAIISALSDLPNETDGLSASALKALFDQGPLAIKAYLNNVLLPALEGAAGAASIGITAPSGMTATTVQSAIGEILTIAQAAQAGTIAPGTITEGMLAFDVATQAELDAKPAGGAGIEIFANDTEMTGSKKADSDAWDGYCLYANTQAGSVTSLATIETNEIKTGLQSIILRMKASNNTNTADTIRVEVQKNLSGTWTTVTSKQFKPTVFNAINEYESLFVPFNYTGTKATDNGIRVVVSLLANAVSFEVDLESVTIVPSTIGVVG